MIQPLRTAHRAVFLLLGFFLPILFAAAIVSRNPHPLETAEAAKRRTFAEPFGTLYFQAGGRSAALQITRLGAYREPRQYMLSSSEPFPAPELLLYWSAAETHGLPQSADALFIGKLVLRREFSLPEGHVDEGYLLLYDAPHQKLLATFPLEKR